MLAADDVDHRQGPARIQNVVLHASASTVAAEIRWSPFRGSPARRLRGEFGISGEPFDGPFVVQMIVGCRHPGNHASLHVHQHLAVSLGFRCEIV